MRQPPHRIINFTEHTRRCRTLLAKVHAVPHRDLPQVCKPAEILAIAGRGAPVDLRFLGPGGATPLSLVRSVGRIGASRLCREAVCSPALVTQVSSLPAVTQDRWSEPTAQDLVWYQRVCDAREPGARGATILLRMQA
jgi:hypothetical protein